MQLFCLNFGSSEKDGLSVINQKPSASPNYLCLSSIRYSILHIDHHSCSMFIMSISNSASQSFCPIHKWQTLKSRISNVCPFCHEAKSVKPQPSCFILQCTINIIWMHLTKKSLWLLKLWRILLFKIISGVTLLWRKSVLNYYIRFVWSIFSHSFLIQAWFKFW